MTIKIAINGYGRIGRNVLRALYEDAAFNKDFKIVAINDLGDVKINAHLTKYDSIYGTFAHEVHIEGADLVVDGDVIKVFAEKDPSKLPWKALDVDVVFECTGKFTAKEKALVHIANGAKKVLVSAPAAGADATIVYGVNHTILRPTDLVVSNGSCTTNCLAPLIQPLQDNIGIVNGLMTTIHAYTNDQVLLDVYHKDLRRARSATQSMIPTKTGAATAIGLVIPALQGKLDGFAVRVPSITVSLVDLTFVAERTVTKDEVNDIMRAAAQGPLCGVLAYNEIPLVSIDFKQHPASSIFESSQTKVLGNTVKVLAWYDNEWAFSIRMLDVAKVMMRA